MKPNCVNLRERFDGRCKGESPKAGNRQGPPFSSQNASEQPTRANIPFSDLDAVEASRTPFP